MGSNIKALRLKLSKEKEEKLRNSIVEALKQFGYEDSEKIEIGYDYGYDPLNYDVKGIVECGNKKLEFKCNELIEGMIISFVHQREKD